MGDPVHMGVAGRVGAGGVEATWLTSRSLEMFLPSLGLLKGQRESLLQKLLNGSITCLINYVIST